MDQNTLKFKTNMDHVVTLMFDSPQTGTNSYGDWFRYGCEYNGQESSFFATGYLHSKLEGYGKGAKLNIRKVELDGGKIGWDIIPEEGTAIKTKTDVPAMNQQRQSTNDERTKDIHKQVCLKLAVQSMGVVDKLDIAEVNTRMIALQLLLEGEQQSTSSEDDKLPF